jgi:putative phosphoribosyl transferase
MWELKYRAGVDLADVSAGLLVSVQGPVDQGIRHRKFALGRSKDGLRQLGLCTRAADQMEYPNMFQDRADAGKQLANALQQYRDQDVVVLALPRGGVAVAAEVASELGASLDLLIVRKVGVPYHQELAMGAVIDGSHPIVVRNDDVIYSSGLSEEEFQRQCTKELQEIERRRILYFGNNNPIDITGRTAILIDDGVATGATARAAILGLHERKPRKIILAVPVAADDTMETLRHDVDEVICLEKPATLEAISFHYGDFSQLTDEDVIAILKRSRTTQ